MTVRPQSERLLAFGGVRRLIAPLLAALAGALLVALLCQLPASHRIDIGGYDAAYVQGFYDPERSDSGAPYLLGSDGTARWSRASSVLLFPQAGLPGQISLRLRGWRSAGPAPVVVVLLNGGTELGRLEASGNWEEHSYPINSGLLKVNDFFVEIRSTPTQLDDGREVGVLLDTASYSVAAFPITPYPAQLLYGAIVGALLWMLTRGQRAQPAAPRQAWQLWAGLAGYGLAWLLFYRLQFPWYPYPLRMLPPLVCFLLATLLALRSGPALAARLPVLLRLVAPVGVIGLWFAATMFAAQSHLTLSRPGVENDFRVFATRESLAQVFSADGFYNLGYPLLLWLARPLFDGNAFLAGRLVAALSGVAFLAGCYWLARALLPSGPALLALLVVALSGVVAQYGLYVGSDMPFAACVTLSVAALTWALGRENPARAGWPLLSLGLLAGLFGGAAFLVRHLGLILLPWGILWSLWRGRALAPQRSSPRVAIAFLLGFLLAAAPQVVINTLQTGQPLYNQQAKNIWLAVYGGTDWGRWEEAPNSVSLSDLLLRDPGRFWGNWWRNIVGYIGSGAEDTSEFGRANQLRLLGWPANWLAVLGLVGLMLEAVRSKRARLPALPSIVAAHQLPILPGIGLVLLIALYVAAVSTAFTLQRFFLPLAPIYAVAAAWAVWRLTGGGRAVFGASLALVVVLWGGPATGRGYVLANQPVDELAAVRMVEAANLPDAPIAARVAARLPLAKYSAIANRVVDWPAGADTARPVTAEELVALREAGARLLLWDEAAGPPPLPNLAAARLSFSGRYGLYQLAP